MEAVEFIRTIQKMCTGRHCDDCTLKENYKCNVIYTEDPEETVRIVEEWAKEQESEKTEMEQMGEELMSKYIDLSKMPQLETWESFREGEGCSFVAVADLIQALRQAEAHTGEVAPVVHGRWLCVDTDTEQFFLCNRCKKKEYWESNYCPNCGCLMDGGDDE